jgi:hypothetical protein
MQTQKSRKGLRKGQYLKKNRAAVLARQRQQARRDRECAARPAATAATAAPVRRDPVWGDDPMPAAPQVPSEPAHAPAAPVEPEEPPRPVLPEFRYVRHAARGPKPEKAKPLAEACDPETGRRRVRINGEEYEVGGGGIADIDWDNF